MECNPFGVNPYANGATTQEEKQRIAACLSSLDAQIAAEAEKQGALRTHKKGLMQQLFPAAEGH